MDKYEFNIKVDKMKKAVDRRDYETAATVADSIVGDRAANAKVLMTIAQIYEKTERYEDARAALTEVYNRVPVGKRVVYKLVELAVKCGDLQEAIDLYREFQEIAPNDPSKLILAYRISVARGEPLEKRIAILEAYRRRDFDEKWAYELATLYQQAGKADECVALCDELILWFGVGPYVDRAMTLKTTYVPLTPEQEEKRENRARYEKMLEEQAARAAEDERASEVPVIRTRTPAADRALAEMEDHFAEDALPAGEQPRPDAAPSRLSESDLRLSIEQELAQSIQSAAAADGYNPDAEVNPWITDKPISVDRVGQDSDGQYTLFQTADEEREAAGRPDRTRPFSFGSLLVEDTRRLDNLRELNSDAKRTAEGSAPEPKPAPVPEPLPKAAPAPEPELAPVLRTAPAAEAVPMPGPGTAPAHEAAFEPGLGTAPAAEAIPMPEPRTAPAPEAVPAPGPGTAPAAEAAPVPGPGTAPAHEAAPAPGPKPAPKPVLSEELRAELTASIPEPKIRDNSARLLFCHVLELDDSEPPIPQLKNAFREAHEVSGIPAASIARVACDKINQAGLFAALKKLQGRDLLLEKASLLTREVLDQLAAAIDRPPCTAVILLADSAAGIRSLRSKAPDLPFLAEQDGGQAGVSEPDFEPEFEPVPAPPKPGLEPAPQKSGPAPEPREAEPAPPKPAPKPKAAPKAKPAPEPEDGPDDEEEDSFFGTKNELPEQKPAKKKTRGGDGKDRPLSPEEFSVYIHRYADENDCKFDSMAELALAAQIERMELSRAPMTKDAADELVDRAISRAERWTFKSLFVSRYDRDGYLILKESHLF